jgi:hypothetical protein
MIRVSNARTLYSWESKFKSCRLTYRLPVYFLFSTMMFCHIIQVVASSFSREMWG